MSNMNYADQINAFLNGEKAIAGIARNLIDSAGKLGAEMDKLESDIQFLFDDGKIDDKKIKSINAGLQRETARYSDECTGITIKVGLKLGEADSVECYIVEAKRDKKKDELLVAVAKFKAATKNGENQAVCLSLAAKVTSIMTNMVPDAIAEAA